MHSISLRIIFPILCLLVHVDTSYVKLCQDLFLRGDKSKGCGLCVFSPNILRVLQTHSTTLLVEATIGGPLLVVAVFHSHVPSFDSYTVSCVAMCTTSRQVSTLYSVGVV